MEYINRLKVYFKANPLIGFAAVIAFVTIFLGIGAYIGTRPQTSTTVTKETPIPTPTEEFTGGTDSDTGTADSDTTASEHKAIPTATETEGNISATPTKSTSPTSGPTSTPTTQTYNINFLGDIYSDDNCSGTPDAGEGKIADVVVNVFKSDNSALTSLKSDGNGHYSYNGTQNKGEQLTLRVEVTAPANFTIHPAFKSATDTVFEGSPSRTHNFPMVPNDKASACPSS